MKRKYLPYKKNKINKYNGVCKIRNKYRAYIRHNGKLINIKYCSNEIECAKAYDKYVIQNNIPNKKLNFSKNYRFYNSDSFMEIKTKYEDTINKNIIRLILNSYPNKKVLINRSKYDDVKYYNWYLLKGYVVAKINNRITKLHKFVMNINDPYVLIDHIDSNILNNCIDNLRISDNSKNAHNKAKTKNTSSKYLGVYFFKPRKNWQASIKYNYQNILIGRYIDEINAARARDLYIKIHLPDQHYKLNFVWNQNDIDYWKKQLHSSKKPNKWIPNTFKEQIEIDTKRILNTMIDDNLLLLEKLNDFFRKKIKNKTDNDCKILKL